MRYFVSRASGFSLVVFAALFSSNLSGAQADDRNQESAEAPAVHSTDESANATRKESDRQNAERIFSQLDRNGDGKLSATEIPDEHKRLFERLLRNAGKERGNELTKGEFLEALAPDDFKVSAPRNLGDPGGGRGMGFNPEQLFQRADRNRDGKLSIDEIPEQASPLLRQLFARLGKNELTREEFLQAVREQNPGGGQAAFMRDPEQFFRRLNPNAEGKVTASGAPDAFRPLVERWLKRLGRGTEGEMTLGDLKQIVVENLARSGERNPAMRKSSMDANP